MKKKLTALLMLIVLITSFMLPKTTMAAELEYPGQYIRLNVSDDVIILTSSTSKYDDAWTKAGIANVSDKIKEFGRMGVIALFYDPETKSSVTFISKHNSATVEQFSFKGKSDQEIIDYVSEGFSSNENVKADVSIIPHDTVNFFRLMLDASASQDASVQGIEVIYGTAINGIMLQFDCYSANGIAPDEEFIRKIVDSVVFTKEITKEEYQAEAEKSARKVLIGVGVFFGALIALAVYAIVRKRVIKKRLAKISEETSAFHEKRKNGTIPDDMPVRYTASCVYNERVINAYTTYNTWIKALPVLAPCGLLYLMIIFLMLTRGYPLYAVITLGIGVWLLYTHYSRLEKLKETMKKRFGVASKPEVTLRFYDDYFDVSGLGAIAEYNYLQITGKGHLNGYTFIYIGDDNAIFFADETVTGGNYGELMSFIKEKRK